MKKVLMYKCEWCGGIFGDEKTALGCEQDHKEHGEPTPEFVALIRFRGE